MQGKSHEQPLRHRVPLAMSHVEQEESRSINNHDISDYSDDQNVGVDEAEDQGTDGDYEINKAAQKKFIPYKPKSKAAMVTLLPSSM